jgi:hypothetical protein
MIVGIFALDNCFGYFLNKLNIFSNILVTVLGAYVIQLFFHSLTDKLK